MLERAAISNLGEKVEDGIYSGTQRREKWRRSLCSQGGDCRQLLDVVGIGRFVREFVCVERAHEQLHSHVAKRLSGVG